MKVNDEIVRNPDSDGDLFIDGLDPLPKINNWLIIIPSLTLLTIIIIIKKKKIWSCIKTS